MTDRLTKEEIAYAESQGWTQVECPDQSYPCGAYHWLCPNCGSPRECVIPHTIPKEVQPK